MTPALPPAPALVDSNAFSPSSSREQTLHGREESRGTDDRRGRTPCGGPGAHRRHVPQRHHHGGQDQRHRRRHPLPRREANQELVLGRHGEDLPRNVRVVAAAVMMLGRQSVARRGGGHGRGVPRAGTAERPREPPLRLQPALHRFGHLVERNRDAAGGGDGCGRPGRRRRAVPVGRLRRNDRRGGRGRERLVGDAGRAVMVVHLGRVSGGADAEVAPADDGDGGRSGAGCVQGRREGRGSHAAAGVVRGAAFAPVGYARAGGGGVLAGRGDHEDDALAGGRRRRNRRGGDGGGGRLVRRSLRCGVFHLDVIAAGRGTPGTLATDIFRGLLVCAVALGGCGVASAPRGRSLRSGWGRISRGCGGDRIRGDSLPTRHGRGRSLLGGLGGRIPCGR
mmetsp:Transcript_2634/g.6889  ORF Transcript_2634/g.6889 Transcript_2634/m.6889 type:complete len:394 (+) Transcript_2634:1372-2553(+)